MGIFVFTYFVRCGIMHGTAGRVRADLTTFAAPLPANTRMESVLCLHNRLSSLLVRLLVAAALSLFGSHGFAQDIYRSGILTFYGDRQASANSLTPDSFLVTLNCKTADPQQVPPRYSIMLRKVDPVEQALFQDAMSGRWNNFDLFRAAMVAEGIRDAELIRTYETRLDALVAKVAVIAQTSGNTSPQAKTRALFEAMHQEILTQPYSLDCTELSKVMKTGHFNCVSATILFNCLAEKAGLDVCALEKPGHALSRVKFAGGAAMDIETTCPTWFDLKNEEERLMAIEARVAPSLGTANPATAQNAVPATAEPKVKSFSDLREISPVQLVATIYYNRGVDLYAKKSHPEAAAANVKALYLDKDNEQAWTNLLVSINNWALDAVDENKTDRLYDLAVILLDRGVSLDPTYENFRSNYVYVFYHWIRDLAGLGQFDKARGVFALANDEKRVPNNRSLLGYMETVRQAEEQLKQLKRQ